MADRKLVSPDPGPIVCSVRRHLAESDVSFEEHVRRQVLRLGGSLRARAAVYLDTCYWIRLRDAAMSRPSGEPYAALLGELTALVAAGHAFCPISGPAFLELIRQTDPASRQATAALVDQLSLGVALCDEETRVATELAHLCHRALDERTLYPLAQLVWVRLPYVLGVFGSRPAALGEAESAAVQKAFFDHLWSLGLQDLLASIEAEPLSLDLGDTAKRLNDGNARHADEIRSFRDTYLREIAGALDLKAAIGADILHWMSDRDRGSSRPSTPDCSATVERQVFGLLMSLAEADRGAEAFPTLHAKAKLHAAVRWDKRRRLDGNTLFDFQHAVAALVYCEVFLTERPLQVLLQQNHVALDRELGCAVFADAGEAIKHVRQLWPAEAVPEHDTSGGTQSNKG